MMTTGDLREAQSKLDSWAYMLRSSQKPLTNGAEEALQTINGRTEPVYPFDARDVIFQARIKHRDWDVSMTRLTSSTNGEIQERVDEELLVGQTGYTDFPDPDGTTLRYIRTRGISKIGKYSGACRGDGGGASFR